MNVLWRINSHSSPLFRQKVTKSTLVTRNIWIVFTWPCFWSGFGTSGADKHHYWKLWECPVTHTALPFLDFRRSAHQLQMAEALVSVGEERGICSAESWPRPPRMVQNQLKPPCLQPASMTQWPWGRQNLGFISPGSPFSLGRQGVGVLVVHKRWIRHTGKGSNCFRFAPAPSPRNVLWPNQIQGSQKTQPTQSQEQLPPPCRHLLSPRAYPEDLVSKLKNSWVCGDKLCGFAL